MCLRGVGKSRTILVNEEVENVTKAMKIGS